MSTYDPSFNLYIETLNILLGLCPSSLPLLREKTTVFNFILINHLFMYIGHVCIYSLRMYYCFACILALQKAVLC